MPNKSTCCGAEVKKLECGQNHCTKCLGEYDVIQMKVQDLPLRVSRSESSAEWKNSLNKILWDNADIEHPTIRPLSGRLQFNLEVLIEELLARQRAELEKEQMKEIVVEAEPSSDPLFERMNKKLRDDHNKQIVEAQYDILRRVANYMSNFTFEDSCEKALADFKKSLEKGEKATPNNESW